MTYSKTQVNDRTDWIGEFKVRVFELDITNYDDDSNGDGEAFGPADATMNRFLGGQPISVEVTDGSGFVAVWDDSNGAVRLYQQANDGTGTATDTLTEVPSNSDEGATVQVYCIGK